MRVISGKYRGKKLDSPADGRVRPTCDRIKETVFNILANRMTFDGARVLDLFAGSGALGIEALSRGAREAVFVDKDAGSVALVKRNLAKIGNPAGRVYLADCYVALKKLEGTAFDLILLDPPYAMGAESNLAALVNAYGLLSDGGILFIEHSAENKLINLPECYIIDTRNCGSTEISFLTRRTELC